MYGFYSYFELFAVANSEKLAIANLARFSVVDAVAVAKIETVGGAKPPNGMLNEPWKIARKMPVEGSGVDPLREPFDDVGTAALGVAANAILVCGAAGVENTGSVQEVMNERIDGDHAGTGVKPRLADQTMRQARGLTEPWSGSCRKRRKRCEGGRSTPLVGPLWGCPRVVDRSSRPDRL